MTKLMRYQRSRNVGYRTPPNTVYVGRPGKFGNRYKVVQDKNLNFMVANTITNQVVSDWTWWTHRQAAWEAVELFKIHIGKLWHDHCVSNSADFAAMLDELDGKNLSCWCKLCDKHRDGKPLDEDCPDCDPCHADAWGWLANHRSANG